MPWELLCLCGGVEFTVWLQCTCMHYTLCVSIIICRSACFPFDSDCDWISNNSGICLWDPIILLYCLTTICRNPCKRLSTTSPPVYLQIQYPVPCVPSSTGTHRMFHIVIRHWMSICSISPPLTWLEELVFRAAMRPFIVFVCVCCVCARVIFYTICTLLNVRRKIVGVRLSNLWSVLWWSSLFY